MKHLVPRSSPPLVSKIYDALACDVDQTDLESWYAHLDTIEDRFQNLEAKVTKRKKAEFYRAAMAVTLNFATSGYPIEHVQAALLAAIIANRAVSLSHRTAEALYTEAENIFDNTIYAFEAAQNSTGADQDNPDAQKKMGLHLTAVTAVHTIPFLPKETPFGQKARIILDSAFEKMLEMLVKKKSTGDFATMITLCTNKAAKQPLIRKSLEEYYEAASGNKGLHAAEAIILDVLVACGLPDVPLGDRARNNYKAHLESVLALPPDSDIAQHTLPLLLLFLRSPDKDKRLLVHTERRLREEGRELPLPPQPAPSKRDPWAGIRTSVLQ